MVLQYCQYVTANFMLWKPIEDLSSNWQDLASVELPPLVTVWNEQAVREASIWRVSNFQRKTPTGNSD